MVSMCRSDGCRSASGAHGARRDLCFQFAFSYPAVLAWAACTAIQRLRKEQDLGNQVAVELAWLRWAKVGFLVIEQRAAWALADSASDGIDRKCRECGQRDASGLQRKPPGSGLAGALHPWQESGLANFGKVREVQSAKIELPGLGRICRPAFRGGFCVLGFQCLGLAQMEPCARRIPRAA